MPHFVIHVTVILLLPDGDAIAIKVSFPKLVRMCLLWTDVLHPLSMFPKLKFFGFTLFLQTSCWQWFLSLTVGLDVVHQQNVISQVLCRKSLFSSAHFSKQPILQASLIRLLDLQLLEFLLINYSLQICSLRHKHAQTLKGIMLTSKSILYYCFGLRGSEWARSLLYYCFCSNCVVWPTFCGIIWVI